jgi:hypothetical protein
LKIFKNKRAQNTAEYAILIALVVGGVIAMQTYAQRTFKGRLRDASVMYRDSTKEIGTTLQYEPYYTNTKDQVTKDEEAVDTYEKMTKQTNTVKGENEHIDITEYHSDAVVTPTGAGTGM